MSIPPPPHPSITPPGEPPPGNFQFHGQQPPAQPQSGQPAYAQPTYPQPGYQQPAQPPYGQPYGYRSNNSKNWMNTVSMITGIVGCFGVTAILAVVFGHMGLAAAKRGEATNRGMGIAGLILGYLGIAANVAFIIWAIWLEVECSANPGGSLCEGY